MGISYSPSHSCDKKKPREESCKLQNTTHMCGVRLLQPAGDTDRLWLLPALMARLRGSPGGVSPKSSARGQLSPHPGVLGCLCAKLDYELSLPHVLCCLLVSVSWSLPTPFSPQNPHLLTT